MRFRAISTLAFRTWEWLWSPMPGSNAPNSRAKANNRPVIFQCCKGVYRNRGDTLCHNDLELSNDSPGGEGFAAQNVLYELLYYLAVKNPIFVSQLRRSQATTCRLIRSPAPVQNDDRPVWRAIALSTLISHIPACHYWIRRLLVSSIHCARHRNDTSSEHLVRLRKWCQSFVEMPHSVPFKLL